MVHKSHLKTPSSHQQLLKTKSTRFLKTHQQNFYEGTTDSDINHSRNYNSRPRHEFYQRSFLHATSSYVQVVYSEKPQDDPGDPKHQRRNLQYQVLHDNKIRTMCFSRSTRIYNTRINSTNQGQAYDDTIHRYDSIRRSLRKVYLRAYTKVNFRQLNYQRYNRLLNKHIQGHKAFLFYITMQTMHESKTTNGNKHTQKQGKHLSFAASTHISRMKQQKETIRELQEHAETMLAHAHKR
jgi:hypothetical protein